MHHRGELTFATRGRGTVDITRDVTKIVADSGINAKVAPDAWAGAVAALVGAIKAHRPGDGFVAAIELCGAELARNFPPGKLNPNELSDRLVEI